MPYIVLKIPELKRALIYKVIERQYSIEITKVDKFNRSSFEYDDLPDGEPIEITQELVTQLVNAIYEQVASGEMAGWAGR